MLWFRSQFAHFSELRKNIALANKRKGVVGRTGRNMPKMPKPSEIKPITRKKVLFMTG